MFELSFCCLISRYVVLPTTHVGLCPSSPVTDRVKIKITDQVTTSSPHTETSCSSVHIPAVHRWNVTKYMYSITVV